VQRDGECEYEHYGGVLQEEATKETSMVALEMLLKEVFFHVTRRVVLEDDAPCPTNPDLLAAARSSAACNLHRVMRALTTGTSDVSLTTWDTTVRAVRSNASDTRPWCSHSKSFPGPTSDVFAVRIMQTRQRCGRRSPSLPLSVHLIIKELMGFRIQEPTCSHTSALIAVS
jgi:hypothetical protein